MGRPRPPLHNAPEVGPSPESRCVLSAGCTVNLEFEARLINPSRMLVKLGTGADEATTDSFTAIVERGVRRARRHSPTKSVTELFPPQLDSTW